LLLLDELLLTLGFKLLKRTMSIRIECYFEMEESNLSLSGGLLLRGLLGGLLGVVLGALRLNTE